MSCGLCNPDERAARPCAHFTPGGARLLPPWRAEATLLATEENSGATARGYQNEGPGNELLAGAFRLPRTPQPGEVLAPAPVLDRRRDCRLRRHGRHVGQGHLVSGLRAVGRGHLAGDPRLWDRYPSGHPTRARADDRFRICHWHQTAARPRPERLVDPSVLFWSRRGERARTTQRLRFVSVGAVAGIDRHLGVGDRRPRVSARNAGTQPLRARSAGRERRGDSRGVAGLTGIFLKTSGVEPEQQLAASVIAPSPLAGEGRTRCSANSVG